MTQLSLPVLVGNVMKSKCPGGICNTLISHQGPGWRVLRCDRCRHGPFRDEVTLRHSLQKNLHFVLPKNIKIVVIA